DGIRDDLVTGVQTCALPISLRSSEATGPPRVIRTIPSTRSRSRVISTEGTVALWRNRDTLHACGASQASSLPRRRERVCDSRRGDRKSVVEGKGVRGGGRRG